MDCSRTRLAAEAGSLSLRTVLFPILILLLAEAAAALPVQVRGNEFFNDRRVRNILPEPPIDFAEYIRLQWAEEAEENVKTLYRRAGFFDLYVEVELGRMPRDPNQWVAEVLIAEGPRYRVDTVSVEFPDSAVIDPKPLGKFRLQPGEYFEFEDLAADLDRIAGIYRNAGYMQVHIQEQLLPVLGDKEVSVRYLVDPGPTTIFDSLIIRNYQGDPEEGLPGSSREQTLRALVPYEAGDTITLKRNRRILANLAATGVFQDLRLVDSLTASGGSILILFAGEREPSQLRAAAFFNAEYGFGGSVDLRFLNLAGTLKHAGTGIIIAEELQQAELNYGSALTLGYRLDFLTRVAAAWYQEDEIHRALETPSFRGDFRLTGNASLSKLLTDAVRATEDVEFLIRSRLVTPESRQRGLFLNLLQTLDWDFLDRPGEPTRGGRIEVTWGNGGALGGNVEYFVSLNRHNWIETNTAFFHPILRQLIAALRLEAGIFLEEGGINTSRFFLGGARTLRSFGFGDVCPEKETVVVAGDPIAVCVEQGIQPAFYLVSAELRFFPFAFVEPNPFGYLRFFAPLSAVVFSDHGAVADLEEGLDYDGPGIGTSFGAGLRYPLGQVNTLRLDAAWGFTGTGEDSFAWVIDLSHAF